MPFSCNFKSIFVELRQSLNLSLPLICSQLIYAVSEIIAAIMIAHLGRDELATNVLVWGIYITLISIFFGILSSVSVLVAQSYGANNKEGINIALNQSIILAIIMAFPMMVAIWFAPKILYLTGQDKTIIELSIPYFHSLAWCMLPLNLLMVMEQFLIGLSNTRIVLLLNILRVPLEILLFYMLFFGKWGAPKLGLAGIGYGLALSISIMFVISIYYIRFSKACRRYQVFFNWRINRKYFFELIRVGLPLGGMYCLEMALFAIIALMMGKFGNDILAAHQIAYQYLVFALAIIFGVSQGTTVRVSYAVGCNDKKALKLASYVNIGIGFCFMLILAVVYVNCTNSIIALSFDLHLLENQKLIEHAGLFLLLAGILQLTDSFRLISVGALRGLKDTKASMYITAMAFWLIAFPCAYLLAFVLNLGGVGIWWGLIIGLAVGAGFLLLRFEYVVKSIDLKLLITK